MKLGYERPLYLMAFDHRASFSKGLFGATGPLSPEIQVRVSADRVLSAMRFEFGGHEEKHP